MVTADFLYRENQHANVLEGRLPEKDNECFLDSLLLEKGEYHVGDTIGFVSGNSENLED